MPFLTVRMRCLAAAAFRRWVPKAPVEPQRALTIPVATAAGKYFILAVADGTVVAEVDENNNLKSRSITVSP